MQKKIGENREYSIIQDKKLLIFSSEYLEGFKGQTEGKIRRGERNLSLSQRKKHMHEIETKRVGRN